MVSALLLVASLPQTVTFSHPGAHSSVVLAAFGKAIGETVRPTGSVLRDYFLVRFDEMPVADAKAAIAKALNATWTVSGGVTYLTRTKAQENEEERQLDEAFREALEAAILEERKDDAERKPYDARAIIDLLRQVKPDEYPEFDMPEDPSERLYSRLVASMELKDLLASPNGTVRYSSRPGRGDKPLPAAWRAAYEKFIEESAAWRDMLGSVFDEEDERRSWFSDYGGRLDEVATFELEIKARDVSLSVGFEWEDGGLSTSRGNIAYAYETNSGLEDLIKGVHAMAKTDAETRSAWQEPDYGDGLSFQYWDSRVKVDPASIAAPLKRCISDLEGNEPLRTLVSWPFVQLAEAKGSNMVVLMPDSLVDWVFGSSLTEKTTLQELFQNWWLPLSASHDANVDCWYLYPSDRPGTRAQRTDRAAFGRMLRAVSRRGWRGIAETADFLSATGAKEVAAGFSNLLSLAECEQPEAFYSAETFGLAVQLYAALPAAVWRSTWGDGIELPVEQWPARLREVLLGHDFSDEQLSPDIDPEGNLDPEEFEAAYRNLPKVADVLRRGLPRGTTMHVSAGSEETLWIERGEYKQQTELESIGWYILSGERDTEGDSRVKALAPGQSETVKFQIRIPGVGTYDVADRFTYVPFASEYKPLDKLDPELRKTIEQSVKRAREGDGMLFFRPGRGGSRLRLR